MHARQIMACAGQAGRIAACGPDELAIAYGMAAIRRQDFRPRIDFQDLGAKLQGDPPLFPESRRPDQEAFKLFFVRQIALRQRRAFIRLLWFTPYEQDRTFEPVLSQRDGALGAAMTGANDNDVRVFHLFRSSYAGADRGNELSRKPRT